MPPAVVAHRGASALEPEHTLPAYERAIADGATGLECDVRLSRDGHLVCVHDRRVDRTSTGRGLVSALSLAELRALDFGGGHGVLTLHALLEMVTSSTTGATLFVETKHPASHGDAVETRLAATFEKFGLAKPREKANSRVVMMSFSSRAVGRFRELLPAVPTVLLFSWLRTVRHDGWLPRWVDIAGPGIDVLRGDPDYVRRARAHAHPTYCWTVEEPGSVELCSELGVDYVATNDPSRTRLLLSCRERTE